MVDTSGSSNLSPVPFVVFKKFTIAAGPATEPLELMNGIHRIYMFRGLWCFQYPIRPPVVTCSEKLSLLFSISPIPLLASQRGLKSFIFFLLHSLLIAFYECRVKDFSPSCNQRWLLTLTSNVCVLGTSDGLFCHTVYNTFVY